MTQNRFADRTPARVNHYIGDTGKTYSINVGDFADNPPYLRNMVKAVRLADSLMARAQFRAVRLPCMDAATDYVVCAQLGHVPHYGAMDGLPRLPNIAL